METQLYVTGHTILLWIPDTFSASERMQIPIDELCAYPYLKLRTRYDVVFEPFLGEEDLKEKDKQGMRNLSTHYVEDTKNSPGRESSDVRHFLESILMVHHM